MWLEQSPLLLEYQALDEKWGMLERSRVYNKAIQEMLEEIGERQVQILNLISYH